MQIIVKIKIGPDAGATYEIKERELFISPREMLHT